MQLLFRIINTSHFPQALQTLASAIPHQPPLPAKVTFKKSNKKYTKTYKCSVTVKNPGVRMAESAMVAVNGKVSVKTSKSWPTTSTVVYTSDKTDIATVDASTGEVTGVKAGEANITATLECGEKTITKSTKVTVRNAILESVKQTKYNTVETVIAGNTSSLKAQDIVIRNKNNNSVVAVQSVAVDSVDSSKVTLTTYASLTDGNVYTVTLEDVTKEFTASDGKIVDVTVSPLQITAGTAGAEVKAQLLDKDQIVVEEYGVGDTLPGKVDYSITGNGYVNGKKYVLLETGNTATAKVVYHTFEYDATGKETGVIEKTFTITAVDDATTVSNWNYTITKDNAVNWKGTVKKVTELATNDTRNAFFYFLDSNKSDVTSQYSVESSDNSILLLAERELKDGSSMAISVTGVNAGTAYINVKKGGKVVTSLPVTVKAARKLTDIKFAKNVLYSSIVVGNTITDKTSIKGYDQYGEEYPFTIVAGTILNAPSSANAGQTKNSQIVLNDQEGIIAPSAQGFAKGDYLVEITARDKENNTVKRTITLKAIDTGSITNSAYHLVLSSKEEDLAVSSNVPIDKVAKNITIGVVETKGNAPVANVGNANIMVRDPRGVVVASGSSIKMPLIEVTSGTSIATKSVMYMGTYSVSAKVPVNDNTTTLSFSDSFTLKDTQTKAVADVKKTTNTGVSSKENVKDAAKKVLETRDVVGYTYEGRDVTDIKISVPDNTVKKNDKALYIGTVFVKVTTTAEVTLYVPVDINRTFTLED